MGAPPPRPARTDVVATVIGVLAALAVTWGVKEGLVRWRAEESAAAFTASWPADSHTKRRLGRVIEHELRPLFARPDYGRASSMWSHPPLWLSDADLVTFQAMRKRMAFASDRACACFWDGGACRQGDLVYGQAELSDDELAVWYRLQARSVMAELDGGPPAPADASEPGASMQIIFRAMSPADQARFDDVTQGRATTRDDLCFAARTLFAGIEKLEPARQGRFMRALMSADARR